MLEQWYGLGISESTSGAVSETPSTDTGEPDPVAIPAKTGGGGATGSEVTTVNEVVPGSGGTGTGPGSEGKGGAANQIPDMTNTAGTGGSDDPANWSAAYRLVVSTDFPPTSADIMGGCNCPATRCSDPDDVQSMVRLLLYSNELEIEALIASAATFANIARKQNILDMIDLYDQVDESLRRRDPRYPRQMPCVRSRIKAATARGESRRTR